ncbi:hypothetical protein DFJ74DRAFT_662767 [Hyaloraphidium curvatum]|nr:hypothetical protein DFJ74DRAFT_662767 [Hyaloraphidium curvatum]
MVQAAEAFDLEEYLERIGFEDEPVPDMDTLQNVVLRHALAIPFENVDAVLGRTPDLSPAGLMAKLVRSRRGGWCHEHVVLLRLVLDDIGFRTRLALARARWNLPQNADVFRGHSVLFVGLPESDEEYLLEVAYGSLRLSAPILLKEGLVQETLHGTCRLLRESAGWLLQVQRGSDWADVVLIEDAPVTAADLDMVNWALANRRGNPINEEATLAMALEGGGRMVLAKGKLTVTENGKKVEQTVTGPEDLQKALEKIGVQLADSDLARRTLRRAFSVPSLPRPSTLARSMPRSAARSRTMGGTLRRKRNPEELTPEGSWLGGEAQQAVDGLEEAKDVIEEAREAVELLDIGHQVHVK